MTRFLLLLLPVLLPFLSLAQPVPCDPPLVASISVSNAPCGGGAVTVTFNLPDDDGDAFDVTYSIGGNNVVLTDIVSGHTEVHSVSTTTIFTLLQVENNDDDDDDCFTNFNQSVQVVVSNIALQIVSQTNPGCGQSNGSITANANNGAGGYQYSLNGGAFQSGATFSNLGAGSYTVVARDAAGCTASENVQLNNAAGPSVDLNGSNPACGQSNGSITAIASGGAGGYQYSLNGGAFQSGATFSNLGAGSYVVVVRDAAGCTDTEDIILSNTNGPSLTLSSSNPACGQSNGSITAIASGGAGGYQYSINGGAFQSGATFSNLGAGSYTVVVRDAAGCTAAANTQLNSANGPALSLSSSNPACGQSNGSITANATGGTGGYEYSLNGGAFQSGATFSNLGAGSYTMVVRDAAGCTAAANTQLNSANGPSLSLSSSNPACGQSNGSITANATGGAGGYEYSLNGGAFQSGATFSNLGAGSYTVVVRDAAGCTATANTQLNSANGPALTLSSNNPACGQSNGSITANATGGAGGYEYSLNGGAFQSGATFSSLGAGSYTVVAHDAAGCTATAGIQLIVQGANAPNAQIQSNVTSGCTNSAFVLNGNLPPGTTGLWTCDEVIPPTPGNPVWMISGAPAGTIQVTWTLSTALCPNYSEATLTLEVLPPPQANADGLLNVPEGGLLQASVLDNDVLAAPVLLRIVQNPKQGTASFDGQDLLNYQPFPTANGRDTAIYEVCYTLCSSVCDTALLIFKNQKSESPCIIPVDTSNILTNGLTPNNDGKNDKLFLRVVSVEECAVNQEESEIVIYNRWGDVVFEASPYKNDWGGAHKDGGELPPGVYYFVLRIKLDKTYTQFGSVIILR
jgi:gliding motility-associated-like protein